LLKFVSNYKDLTRLPHPVFMNIKLEELFEHICNLMKKEMDQQGYTFEVHSEGPELAVYADKT